MMVPARLLCPVAMRALATVVCFTHAAALAGSGAAAEEPDAVSHLQLKVRRVGPLEGGRAACTCLTWTQVYSKGLARLGAAKEHLPHGDYAPYRMLSNNYCIKFDYASHTVSNNTWCYVPAACGELNGGARVNQKVSWKQCRKEEDTLLASMPPGAMVDFIYQTGWLHDPTLIPVLSYPYSTETWSQVGGFYSGKDGPLQPELRAKMSALRDSRRPMVICDSLSDYGNGNPDACGIPGSLHLVAGDEVWYFQHWGKPVCERGCSAAA